MLYYCVDEIVFRRREANADIRMTVSAPGGPAFYRPDADLMNISLDNCRRSAGYNRCCPVALPLRRVRQNRRAEPALPNIPAPISPCRYSMPSHCRASPRSLRGPWRSTPLPSASVVVDLYPALRQAIVEYGH